MFKPVTFGDRILIGAVLVLTPVSLAALLVLPFVFYLTR